jgi:GMP synthase-like glutamine amidotransferase
MKLVVVSQRVDYLSERNETRDSLDQRLVRFLQLADCFVMPIPNVTQLKSESETGKKALVESFLDKAAPSAIVLSGGNDIGEYPDRDKTEHALLDYAERQHLPVLGICRGMQLMAVRNGATLLAVEGYVGTRQEIKGEICREITCYHKFAVARVPKDFSALAHSKDGTIEAIRHIKLPWEGWMWHPEREDQFLEQDIERLKQLFL